jgi:hypothetical protein
MGPTGPEGPEGGPRHWVAVRDDGGVARQSGGITVSGPSFFTYRVDFGVNVSNCIYIATVADPADNAGPFGVARPRRATDDVKDVLVSTVGDQGNGVIGATTLPFHLAVFC